MILVHDLDKAVEKFLEEGRRFNVMNNEMTPEKLVEHYEKQRQWFHGFLAAASLLAVLILGFGVALAYFDLSMGSSGGGTLSGRALQSLHTHSLCMLISIVIGFPLGTLI